MSNRQFQCTGWWEQTGYGRQTMSELWLQFDRQKIVGTGTDVVGRFTLSGRLEEGQVHLNKKYLDKHTVVYQGHYDGEGTLHGRWALGWDHGKWLIRIDRSPEQSQDLTVDEIPEFEPVGLPT